LVPGGSFGPGDGVPAGYYFVFADSLVQPTHTSAVTTGFVWARLGHYDSKAALVDFHDFELSSESETQANSFTAPLFVLAAGDYLAVSNPGTSTHTLAIAVTGYLTDQPEKLRL
jgi:hypothetical protein